MYYEFLSGIQYRKSKNYVILVCIYFHIVHANVLLNRLPTNKYLTFGTSAAPIPSSIKLA